MISYFKYFDSIAHNKPDKSLRGHQRGYFTNYNVVNLNKVKVLLLLLFMNSVLFSLNAFSQREVDISQFSAAYFDSVRTMVYDTTNVNFIINAQRLTELDEVVIDGQLNEPIWKNAEHRGSLIEKEPYPLIPMREDTEFAILYDNENLYIGVWCWDSEPDKIIQRLAPRGTSGPDHLMLFLDSYFDKRTGYKFMVTPTGVQGDELRYDDVKRDNNWNGIWYSEGSVDEKGWYAEVKIPFFNLRYSSKEQQTWGFNIMRTISKFAARGQWKPHLPEWDNTTRMSQLGEIRNIQNISSGRTFEIRPYGTVSSTKSINLSPLSSFNFGGDIRYSPTPNITADFTFNPDFAQVDADVFEINLTRFPTRFKELRPFFTERINVFNTPLELFYSRRIGAKGDILGGVKMTGKLNHGVEFGVIGNLTGESIFSSSLQNAQKATFGVMRVKKDILGSSSIGILAATKEEADNYNRIVGVDGSFMLNDNDIIDVQISSGQNELEYDENMAYNMSYIRTGDLWGFNLNFERIEPAFEINRIGYIQKESDRGWNKGAGVFRVSPRINKHNIRRIIATFEYEYSKDLFTTRYINRWLQAFPDFIPNKMFGTVAQNSTGEQTITDGVRDANNFNTGADISVSMMNEMLFSANYKYYSATELTGNYTGDLLKINYSTRPVTKGSKIAGLFSASSGTLYNFNQKYVGRKKSISADGKGRMSYNLLTSLQGEFTKTFNPGGENDGRYFKVSSNSTWMFSKDFYIRLHAQGIFGTTHYGQKQIYNDYLLSGLLSWEYRPGSFLYLAYNEGRFDTSDTVNANYFKLKNRTLIFKISYFFSV
ncbi:MAG: carbohydrate binding family 9 domain-containing protein [Bacteroidetes bacterium]|nr:carbohydrate binding family 9 domain-containing protein [Bacteroidota bacterium]